MLVCVRAPLYTQASSLPIGSADACLGPHSPVHQSKLIATLPIECWSGSVFPCTPKQAHCHPANRMLVWVRAPLYTRASSLPPCQSNAGLGPYSPVHQASSLPPSQSNAVQGPCSPVHPSKLTATLPIECWSGSVFPCTPSKLTATLPIECCAGSVLPCTPKQAHCHPANRMLCRVRAPLYTQASSLPPCQSNAGLGAYSPAHRASSLPPCQSDAVQGPCSPAHQASSLPPCQSDAVQGPCSPVHPSKLTATLPIECWSGPVFPCTRLL